MKMNGPKKSAIFLMDLGEEKSTEVLVNMDEEEIQTPGNYMSILGEIATPVMGSVNRDFYNLVETAQQNIIYMCKQLEENGKTLISGGEALV